MADIQDLQDGGIEIQVGLHAVGRKATGGVDLYGQVRCLSPGQGLLWGARLTGTLPVCANDNREPPEDAVSTSKIANVVKPSRRIGLWTRDRVT